jgi:leader peptidase (prepilin peptidase)/N-methyltransferase
MPSALAGYLVGVGVLWGITLLGRVVFGKDAMGHGDIKLARGIGAVIGPIPALMSFAIAVVLGAVLGLIQKYAFQQPTSVGGNGESSTIDEEEYEPESIGSIFKSGIGYLLSLDIVGLFIPKFYEKWFGEPPFVSVEEEEYPIGSTMIPFGPYLALGAIAAVVFQSQLLGVVDAYLRSFGPS